MRALPSFASPLLSSPLHFCLSSPLSSVLSPSSLFVSALRGPPKMQLASFSGGGWEHVAYMFTNLAHSAGLPQFRPLCQLTDNFGGSSFFITLIVYSFLKTFLRFALWICFFWFYVSLFPSNVFRFVFSSCRSFFLLVTGGATHGR